MRINKAAAAEAGGAGSTRGDVWTLKSPNIKEKKSAAPATAARPSKPRNLSSTHIDYLISNTADLDKLQDMIAHHIKKREARG